MDIDMSKIVKINLYDFIKKTLKNILTYSTIM